MSEQEEIYDQWNPVVSRIAGFVSRDYPDVDSEDLAQDLFVLILERGWSDPQSESAGIILRRYARAKAATYRAQHLSVTPQYAYRTSEVREILQEVFEYDNWPRRSIPTYPKVDSGQESPQWDIADLEAEGLTTPEGATNQLPRVMVESDRVVLVGGRSAPAVDWDDKIAGFVDVKRGWKRLPLQYKQAIFKHYALRWELGDTELRRVRRAVERLTDILNTPGRS